MPEEWRTPAGGRPSNRAEAASGSDGPKSAGNWAISTLLSLERRRRYPRGRGRGGRRMSAMEVTRSMSRVLEPLRRLEEDVELVPPEVDAGMWGRWSFLEEDELLAEAAAVDAEIKMRGPLRFLEEDFELVPPEVDAEMRGPLRSLLEDFDLVPPEVDAEMREITELPSPRVRTAEGAVAVKRRRSTEGAVAYKRPRLAEGAMADHPQESYVDFREMVNKPDKSRPAEVSEDYIEPELVPTDKSRLAEVSEDYIQPELVPTDKPRPAEVNDDYIEPELAPRATDKPRPDYNEPELVPTDKSRPAKVNDDYIEPELAPRATDKSRPAEVSDDYNEPELVPRATDESRPAEGPVAGKADNEIALAKGRVEEPVAAKIDGLIATKKPRQEERVLEKPLAGKTAAEIALAARLLPCRYPVYPRNGKPEDILHYNKESQRIRRLNKQGHDSIKNLPTRLRTLDRDTAASLKSPQEKHMCLDAAKSVVAITSVWPGHENHCSGVIISFHEDGEGTLKILTASGILYNVNGDLHSPELKVSVQLQNNTVKYEGHILFVNKHYRIAILEVRVGSSIASLSFGSMPQYGQRVISLGRDCADIFARDGLISMVDWTALGRSHYMFLESERGFPLHCIGGPVIAEDGTLVGIITCHIPEAAMISIHIVQICIEMWRSYSCIARPQLNMDLRTMWLVGTEHLDKLECICNKSRSGFIVDGVEYDSAHEKLGIREGDVIEILDENCGPTLPELESYLLSHGLRFLAKMKGVSLMKELELKIRVHAFSEGEWTATDTLLSIPVANEVAVP